MAKYLIEVIDRKTNETIGEFVKDKNNYGGLPLKDIAEEVIGNRNIFIFATRFKYTVKEI